MDCKGYLLPLTLIVRFKKKEFTYKTQGKVAKMATKYGDPINSLTRMLRSELGEHLIPVEDFVDMFTENGVMEFPYSPEGRIQKLEGHDAMKDYFEHVRDLIAISDMMNPQTYISQDGKNAIVEFECQGEVVATGRPYNQKYVSVISLSEGKISRYRDYWNPLVLINALKDENV